MNIVLLQGVLSRALECRELASGVVLATAELTVHEAGEPAVAVPLTWFTPPPAALGLAAGEAVQVTGRIRRRFYRSGGLTQSRTDVVVVSMVPTRQGRKARIALERALAATAVQ